MGPPLPSPLSPLPSPSPEFRSTSLHLFSRLSHPCLASFRTHEEELAQLRAAKRGMCLLTPTDFMTSPASPGGGGGAAQSAVVVIDTGGTLKSRSVAVLTGGKGKVGGGGGGG